MTDVTQAEFVRMVKRMRALQKEFFRLTAADRPPSLIRDAKRAETTVDKLITEFDQGQQTLFAEDT